MRVILHKRLHGLVLRQAQRVVQLRSGLLTQRAHLTRCHSHREQLQSSPAKLRNFFSNRTRTTRDFKILIVLKASTILLNCLVQSWSHASPVARARSLNLHARRARNSLRRHPRIGVRSYIVVNPTP